MPTVSAIITTFNRKQFLGLAIGSVLAQTYANFELLILDNSSSDGTEQLVAEFPDARIRYIRHPEMNIAQQRNLGLGEAQGEYVAFLDDDDEWLPRKLELQLGVFAQGSERLALVYGGLVWVDPVGRELGGFKPNLRGRVLNGLLAQNPFTGSASNPMMRASALKAISGYDNRITTGEDWELYLRLAERYEVDYTPEPVLRIRQHPGARLGDRVADKMWLEELVLARYGAGMSRALRSFYLQKIGGKLCRIGKVAEGRRRIMRAIAAHPFNGRAYVQYASSFFGTGFYRHIHRAYRRMYSLKTGIP